MPDIHAVAAANITAHESLLDLLTARTAEIGADVVAARLDVTADQLEDALDGANDLTLTELRYLALALEVTIEYGVEPAGAAAP